mmetsp:Transcript_15514/g.44324  ORF Transcript_15514/g.44324 Transcript_15514/m.44324 type:complete len:265 (-) Transcript_15514:87-881(-)
MRRRAARRRPRLTRGSPRQKPAAFCAGPRRVGQGHGEGRALPRQGHRGRVAGALRAATGGAVPAQGRRGRPRGPDQAARAPAAGPHGQDRPVPEVRDRDPGRGAGHLRCRRHAEARGGGRLPGAPRRGRRGGRAGGRPPCRLQPRPHRGQPAQRQLRQRRPDLAAVPVRGAPPGHRLSRGPTGGGGAAGGGRQRARGPAPSQASRHRGRARPAVARGLREGLVPPACAGRGCRVLEGLHRRGAGAPRGEHLALRVDPRPRGGHA